MKYELFYLVPTRYTDAEVEGIMEKVSGMITKAGGAVSRHENMGRLKLAYPIKGNNNGVYVLAQFEAETSIVSGLDRQLRLSDELLRHQLTLMPKGADTKQYKLMSYVAPLTEEGSRREEGPRASSAGKPAGRTAAAVPSKAEPAMDVETINKKLDEMLTEDVSKQA